MIQHRAPVEDRMQQPCDTGQETRPVSQLKQYVEKNPSTSTFVAFGVGLGAGLGAGLMLSCLLRESTDYFGRDNSLADQIGNRVRASVQDAIPSSWKDRFPT